MNWIRTIVGQDGEQYRVIEDELQRSIVYRQIKENIWVISHTLKAGRAVFPDEIRANYFILCIARGKIIFVPKDFLISGETFLVGRELPDEMLNLYFTEAELDQKKYQGYQVFDRSPVDFYRDHCC